MSNKTRLKELIQKVVDVAVPDKIILFGSRAKGEQTEESDYDICVIKRGIFHKKSVAQRIYLKLDVDVSFDVIVETPERFNELKDNPFLIYNEIAKHGRVVYEK
jgi:predicted nucleotidyltransferase